MISSFLNHSISFLERKNRPVIVLLIALYILAGVIYSFYLGNSLRFLPDEADYYNLATNLVSKGEYSMDGVHVTAYRPPGYPFFLAPFRFLGFDVVGLRILNFFTLGLCIFVLFKMLRDRFAPLAGLLGALLIIAYPLIFYTAGTLYPQTLASLLLVLTIYFYTHETGRTREIILAGLLAGLLAGWLILTVPTFIFILVVLAVWSWIYQRHPVSFRVLPMLVIAILVVGAWTLRNYAAFNTFVFVTSNSGENLLIGNSENTTPNGGRTIDISNYENQAAGLDEIHRDQYYRNQAINYIMTHKLELPEDVFFEIPEFFQLPK